MILHLRALRSPEKTVPALAEHYLQSLATNNYAMAYDLLSRGARAQVSLDEFRLARETAPWSWANVTIAHVEPDAVVLEYDLTGEGRPATKDSLIFIREEGQWVHPFVGVLLKQAQEALERADPDMALIKTQEAVRLNPRDPAARAVLCEAAYYRRLTDRVESECPTALALAQRYSLPLSNNRRYKIHAMLADTYKNSRRYSQALENYSAMLTYPGLNDARRCEVLLARSETYAAHGDRIAAERDAQEASAKCPSTDQR